MPLLLFCYITQVQVFIISNLYYWSKIIDLLSSAPTPVYIYIYLQIASLLFETPMTPNYLQIKVWMPYSDNQGPLVFYSIYISKFA